MKRKEEQMGLYDMNFGWKFSVEEGERQIVDSGHGEVYQSTKAGMGTGARALDFDDGEWEKVRLPHDWVTQKEFDRTADYDAGYKKRGKAWYRRKFVLPVEDEDKQLLLYFEGMSCEASIYVNGQLMYRNHSGYNSFFVDFTDMANFGDTPNILAIFVDASSREGWWYEGAGIYRPVWMIKKPTVHIVQNGCFAKTEPIPGTPDWNVIVKTDIESSREKAKSGKICCRILDNHGSLVDEGESDFALFPFSRQEMETRLHVKHPDLWDVETPCLYKMQVELHFDGEKQDAVTFQFGFRTVEFDARSGFYINGRAEKLKGFCNHQDHPGVGVAVPYAIKEYRIDKLKALGANAYRCAHNTDPDILEICDRKGMFVMEENRTFNSSEENLRILQDMVKVSRNHPSVILYSLFNEEPLQGTRKGRKIAERMKHALRQADDTRPVTGAMNGGYLEKDGAVAVLDVVGINYNPAAYDKFHELFPDKPVLGSETCSAYSVRGEYMTDWEAHRIDNFDENPALWGNNVREGWKMIADRAFVAGTFVWTGFDYRGEPTPFTWPSVASFFGTYDSCGFEKDSCYFYKAFWGKEPVVHLVCDWEEKADAEELEAEKSGAEKQGADKRKVMIISNCEEVVLTYNGSEIFRGTVEPVHPFLEDIPYSRGVLKAVGCQNGEEVAWDEKWSSGEAADIRIQLSKGTLMGDRHDAILVNAAICDKEGHLTTNCDTMVEFCVSGGAELIGVGNGDPNSHEPDVSHRRSAFHGLVQAVIRNCGMEDAVIQVSAAGIQKQMTIPVQKVETIPEAEIIEERILNGFKLYYQLFEEMPAPDLQVDENDMNRFEAVAFEGKNQPMLYKQYGKYALYRTETVIHDEKRFLISQCCGRVWVYAGNLLLGMYERQNERVEIEIPDEVRGKTQLNIIVQNIDKDWGEAGISSAVKLLPV